MNPYAARDLVVGFFSLPEDVRIRMVASLFPEVQGVDIRDAFISYRILFARVKEQKLLGRLREMIEWHYGSESHRRSMWEQAWNERHEHW